MKDLLERGIVWCAAEVSGKSQNLILRTLMLDTLTGVPQTITLALTHRRYRIVSRCVWLDEPVVTLRVVSTMEIINAAHGQSVAYVVLDRVATMCASALVCV